MDFRAALDARNRADLKDVRFQLFMAIPATLLGFGFANVLGLFLWVALSAFGAPVVAWTWLLLFNLVLPVIVLVDIKRNPEESWYVPRYLQSDGSLKGNELGGGSNDPILIYMIERHKGVFGGMPLMTRVLDPGNMAERGRAISSGFANLILGGPRSLARAFAERRQIVRRSQRRNVASGEAFFAWLSSHGPLPEEEVKKHLEAHPEQAAGYALAREIDVVARFRNPVDFHYRVR